MVNCIAYDVEVLPNFFSITFVSINDYLKKFKDCVNASGKPIPLVQKYSVAEIKSILNTIDKKQFYITDKNDNQLFQMVDYINKMKAVVDDNGNYINRTDLYGFNSFGYDNLMIAALLSMYIRCDTTKELCFKLYETSKLIIDSQNDKDRFNNNFHLTSLKRFKLPFLGLDVMRIFALNKASTYIDSTTGEKRYMPKSLKQTSINLQWYELLEYEIPDIDDTDIELFYHKNDKYKGYTANQLNKLIDKWDRYIRDEYIDDMMHYNLNDVYIVAEIVRLNPDEIKSRYSVSQNYKIDVLNSSRSNMADRMFEVFYNKFSGLRTEQWKNLRTERTAMSFKKVIFPNIKFETKPLQDLLDELLKVTIYRVNKDAFSKDVVIGNITYSVATGGLHSQDVPMEIWSTSEFVIDNNPSSTGNGVDNPYTIYHYDVASFYPSIMSHYKIAPAHMNNGAFCNLITWMKNKRVDVKHSKEDIVDGVPRDVLALVLKIVINSIYGKFGFEKGALYDRLAVLKVTINGQLMLLMLCEKLELNDIHIISANTDGIMVKVYDKDKAKFDSICEWWKEATGMNADSDIVHCLIARDVNNYIAQFRVKDKKTGANKLKLEYKGAMNPLMYAVDLQKGYDMPIVAEAVENYFLKNIPVMQTLQKATNILDFCKTQNVGKEYHVEVVKVENGNVVQIPYQRYVRFYVSNNGYVIKKVHNTSSNINSRLAAGNVVTILNTLNDLDISFRDINYKYYYLEAMKIIEPIKQGTIAKGKGRTKIRKYSGMYNKLFDDE